MKRTHKIMIMVLAFTLILSLTACGKKPIDIKKFKDVLEDKFDFEVEKISSAEKDIDKIYSVKDEDSDYIAYYMLYEESDDAQEKIEEYIENIEESIEDDEFDGTIKVSGSGKYKKVVSKGEYDSGDRYAVAIRTDNLVIIVGVKSDNDKHVDKVNDIVKALGY